MSPAEGVTELDAADREVVRVIESLYASLGDRAAFDAHLAPDLTFWESDCADLRQGLDGLEDLRTERRQRTPAHLPAPAWVRPDVLAVDRWADVAVVRYELRAHHPGREDETFRVTDVLRADRGGWRIVHHHAERRS